MPAANHHIFAEQGSTFKLFFEYQTQGSTAIDLTGYDANMQVRRSKNDTELLLQNTGNTENSGVKGGETTGGGSGGSGGGGGGVLGTGKSMSEFLDDVIGLDPSGGGLFGIFG